MSAGIETVTPDELRQRMLDQVARHRAPSVSVAYAIGDGPAVGVAAGRAKVFPAHETSPIVAYLWFSVTKLFTATAVLQLAETGMIRLDDPVSQYVPSFSIKSSRLPTVRNLLAHTSGLANPIPVGWVHLAGEPGPSLDQLTDGLLRRHPTLSFVPGTRFSYSNLNYLILGLLIERISGEKYQTFVNERILRPLGAVDAGFVLPQNAATGYSRLWSFMGIAARWMLDGKFFGPTIDGYTELRPFLVDGAPYGGLVGPPTQMLLLGRAMLARGRVEGGTILRPETVDAALTASRASDGAQLPIGLGWHLGALGGEPYAYHIGGGGGFRSELRIYPRLKYAIAVIANETSFNTAALTRLVVSSRQSA